MSANTQSNSRSSKAKEIVPIEIPTDFSEAISSIERDLNRHRIGTFKVHYKDMTFKWQDHENRLLNSMDRMAALSKSMQNGLYRTDNRHRMSGVVAREKIEKRISSPSDPSQIITFKEVQRFNEQAMFPGVLFPKSHPTKDIEMQSGKH